MELTGSQIHVGEVTCGGGSLHLSCKYDQIKVRDYMDRRVTSHTFFCILLNRDVYNKFFLQGIYSHQFY